VEPPAEPAAPEIRPHAELDELEVPGHEPAGRAVRAEGCRHVVVPPLAGAAAVAVGEPGQPPLSVARSEEAEAASPCVSGQDLGEALVRRRREDEPPKLFDLLPVRPEDCGRVELSDLDRGAHRGRP
jgi:hypothetical protein